MTSIAVTKLSLILTFVIVREDWRLARLEQRLTSQYKLRITISEFIPAKKNNNIRFLGLDLPKGLSFGMDCSHHQDRLPDYGSTLEHGERGLPFAGHYDKRLPSAYGDLERGSGDRCGDKLTKLGTAQPV
ncbi:hypothetical protein LguiA_017467 [Lonicera macranthoides]